MLCAVTGATTATTITTTNEHDSERTREHTQMRKRYWILIESDIGDMMWSIKENAWNSEVFSIFHSICRVKERNKKIDRENENLNMRLEPGVCVCVCENEYIIGAKPSLFKTFLEWY